MKKTLILVVLFALCFGLNALTATKATWTTSQETVNGQDFFIAYTSTAVTTADRVVYTEPTDFKLNWDAPIIVIVNPDAGTYDDATLPVTMYCGYSDDFSLVVGTTGTPAIVDGWMFGDIMDDVKDATGQVRLFGMPNTVADVAYDNYFVAPCTELAFEITAATDFPTATIEIIIMQPTNLNIPSDWHKTYKQEAYK
jgi:hypothetical protein